ncbi:hypothetical protein FA95DRAFT_255123 [Auriscalpium vulgare]|uniref:Uncharacterized protein n=1 Tax=Auriscalpium vulgare TaxID=40419 RepID=A0ACB8RKR3_9AGAM|nr:hypothetical protein FA95DRAFT_255123 [Auriscalpium vulgare]
MRATFRTHEKVKHCVRFYCAHASTAPSRLYVSPLNFSPRTTAESSSLPLRSQRIHIIPCDTSPLTLMKSFASARLPRRSRRRPCPKPFKIRLSTLTSLSAAMNTSAQPPTVSQETVGAHRRISEAHQVLAEHYKLLADAGAPAPATARGDNPKALNNAASAPTWLNSSASAATSSSYSGGRLLGAKPSGRSFGPLCQATNYSSGSGFLVQPANPPASVCVDGRAEVESAVADGVGVGTRRREREGPWGRLHEGSERRHERSQGRDQKRRQRRGRVLPHHTIWRANANHRSSA